MEEVDRAMSVLKAEREIMKKELEGAHGREETMKEEMKKQASSLNDMMVRERKRDPESGERRGVKSSQNGIASRVHMKGRSIHLCDVQRNVGRKDCQ